MSWQGDQIHFQNGGAHDNPHGNAFTLSSVNLSSDFHKIDIISKLNETITDKPKSQDGVTLKNGIIVAVLEPCTDSSRFDCEEVNGCETVTMPEEIDAARFVSNTDIDVQKVDEWLKQRSDSLSSIDFESETKHSEETYEYEQMLKIQGKLNHAFHESKLNIDNKIDSKLLLENDDNGLEFFPSELDKNAFTNKKDICETKTTDEPIELTLTTKLDVKNSNNCIKLSCTEQDKVSYVDCDSHSSSLDVGEKLLNSSFATHSHLNEDENELMGNSKEELTALEFKELDKNNTLMTPQELESMPERGLEFEESVGPREKQSFEEVNLQEKHPTFMKNSVETLDGEDALREDFQTIPIFLTTGANCSTDNIEQSSVPISAVATISVTTDKSNNTVTKIIINTPQGQAIKINGNSTNILTSNGRIQPLNLSNVLITRSNTIGDTIENALSDSCKSFQQVPYLQVEQISAMEENLTETGCNEQVEVQQMDSQDVANQSGKVWHCLKPGCSRVYDKKCKLKVHMMNHSGERPFRCYFDGCDWAFTTAYKLKRHTETHERKKDYVCDVEGCRKKFTTVYNLNTHKKLHIRPNIVKCPVHSCHMMFPTRRRMELHLKEHDGMEAPYKCPLETCGKEYYTANSISTHMRVHQKAELRCSFEGCGKIFDKTCRLQQHMRQHTGERPYVCKVEGCGWAFVSASKLTRHMRKHTGERRYTCPEENCGKSFMRAEHLQGHMVVHSQSKPFVCPHENCSAKFTAKSSLYVHLKKHNGNVEKPTFKCPVEICDKKYNCKSSLRIHMLKFHTPGAETNQMDYITLLSNENIQEITGLEGVAQDMPNGSGVTVSVPSITIPVATTSNDPTLISPNDFITPTLPQDVMTQQLSEGIITQFVMNNEISGAPSLKINSVREVNSLSSGETDLETICTSRVSQENNSGSARTDYCSNHVLTGKTRKCRNNQQTKGSSHHLSAEINKCTLTTNPSVMNNKSSVALAQPDGILPSTTIRFRDPTSGTEFVQTQLLQDDPPTGELYQDDNLLVPIGDPLSLTGELTVPVSLLSDVPNNDCTSEANIVGVPEFNSSTISVGDLE